MWNFLLKDPLFLVASFVFLAGLGVFFACIHQLWALTRGGKAPGSMPGGLKKRPLPAGLKPALPPQVTPSAATPEAPTAPPQASSAVSEQDASVMYGVLEEKFSELNKRIAIIESALSSGEVGSGGGGTGDGGLLGKRIESVEGEVNNLKLFLADAPAPGGGGDSADLSALTEKVKGLQKILETLTAETEIAKPS